MEPYNWIKENHWVYKWLDMPKEYVAYHDRNLETLQEFLYVSSSGMKPKEKYDEMTKEDCKQSILLSAVFSNKAILKDEIRGQSVYIQSGFLETKGRLPTENDKISWLCSAPEGKIFNYLFDKLIFTYQGEGGITAFRSFHRICC